MLDTKALKYLFLGYGVDKKRFKCYHPPTHRKFVSSDVTFFEFLPFFSSGWTSLHGEPRIGENFSSVPLPLLVPIYHFDGRDGGKGEHDDKGENTGEKELKYYSQRRKQERVQEQDPPSLEPL